MLDVSRLGLISRLFAVAVIVVPTRAGAVPDDFCLGFAAAVVQNTKNVLAMGGCGFDKNDISMSTNQGKLYRWCQTLQEETAKEWLKELALNTDKCGYCNANADVVTALAVENANLKCGFEHPDGRWSTNRKDHFDGCMQFSAEDRFGVVYRSGQTFMRLVGYPVLGEMTQRIAECKKTHRPPVAVCKTCHETQKPTALLPAALRPPPKRGTGSHDFSVARQPPSIKQGTSSGDSDKAQPSGERRRTPSGGSSTSAMDRLGGGGTGGAPSAGGGQSGGRSAPKPSAGGGASSETPSGRAPNIGTNTIMQPGGTTPGGRSPGLR
jgi:hypothetical protein